MALYHSLNYDKNTLYMIIIVFGLPGSGKSYFASRLAERINAGYVNSDKIRKTLFPARTYSQQEKESVYETMQKQTLALLQLNRHVIVDATFHRADRRKKFIDGLSGNAISFIEIWAMANLARQRVEKPREWSEAGPDVLKRITEQWETMTEAHLKIESTNDNIEQMLQQAINHLALDT